MESETKNCVLALVIKWKFRGERRSIILMHLHVLKLIIWREKKAWSLQYSFPKCILAKRLCAYMQTTRKTHTINTKALAKQTRKLIQVNTSLQNQNLRRHMHWMAKQLKSTCESVWPGFMTFVWTQCSSLFNDSFYKFIVK